MKKQKFELKAEHVLLGLFTLFIVAVVQQFVTREGVKLGNDLANKADRYW